jgi:hypothetical protein
VRVPFAVATLKSEASFTLRRVRDYAALGWSLSRHQHFHQFDPIAEGVVNISTLETFKRRIIFAGKSGIPQPDPKSLQIVHHDGRVRLRGGTKIVLNSEMYADPAILKPTAATFHERFRLRYLGHTQRVGIEPASSVFFARWHRQLYMFNPLHGHINAGCSRFTVARPHPTTANSEPRTVNCEPLCLKIIMGI